MMTREAEFYIKETASRVCCQLCPHNCLLADQQTGLCRSRINQQGILYATNYGRWTGIQLDPIEKKPLYHYHPGSQIMSLGPNSCNLSCDFCQNFEISQVDCPTIEIGPEQLRDLMISRKQTQVAFTYSEPLTAYEFILDFAQLSPEIEIILISNGFINPEPLARLIPFVSAMNIDLKSIRDSFYRQRCAGTLAPVLDSIKTVYKSGIHLEITNLLIPGANDDPQEIKDLIDFCADISPDLPLHFSAYHPAYKSREQATPPETVLYACELAASRLNFVYAGNLGATEYTDTLCPECGSLLIDRSRGRVTNSVKSDGTCQKCGRKICGVF